MIMISDVPLQLAISYSKFFTTATSGMDEDSNLDWQKSWSCHICLPEFRLSTSAVTEAEVASKESTVGPQSEQAEGPAPWRAPLDTAEGAQPPWSHGFSARRAACACAGGDAVELLSPPYWERACTSFLKGASLKWAVVNGAIDAMGKLSSWCT